MKKILFVVGCFFVTSAQAMEGEDKYAATVAERFDLSVPWNTLPLELMKAIQSEYVNCSTTIYKFREQQPLISYGLRSINPVNLIYSNETNINLKPTTVEKPILLDLQYWPSSNPLFFESRLCLQSAVTNDYFCLEGMDFKDMLPLFDGINSNRLALITCTGKHRVHTQGDFHCVYVLRQSKDYTGIVQWGNIRPALLEKGFLCSILLHRESNRCVRGIKDVEKDSNLPHCITIGDICKVTAADNNAYVNTIVPVRTAYDRTVLSSDDKCETVALLATDFVLKRAIYVGKDTYLGLTEEGSFIVFWLNDENKIEYAHQDCHGKQFKDLDVDETSKTGSGFMSRVALLAKNGDVFLTDLRMGREKKVLLYSRTLDNPDNIFRFLYDKEQYAVVYKVDTGEYDTFHVWPDNFNILLAHVSLKKHGSI